MPREVLVAQRAAMPRRNLMCIRRKNPGFLGLFVDVRRPTAVAAGQNESFPQNIAVITGLIRLGCVRVVFLLAGWGS
jgi:hypothetical protein